MAKNKCLCYNIFSQIAQQVYAKLEIKSNLSMNAKNYIEIDIDLDYTRKVSGIKYGLNTYYMTRLR